MKNLILSVLLLVALSYAESQEISVAPINQEFLDFMDSYNSVKSGTQNGYYTGLTPSPFTFHFSSDTTNERYNAIDLPSLYDLRSVEDGAFLSTVKNQGTSGTCWAFAVYGSSESYILQQYTVNYDFSEQNLATCHGFDWEPDFGGNFLMPMAYFSRHAGPIAEYDDPYAEPTNGSVCINNLDPPVFIEKAFFLPGSRDRAYTLNQIKQALIDYGALAVNLYYNSLYYNPNDYTYFYNNYDLTNHAVIIIGWDDDKIVTGGSDSPTSPGAWIARNSWGDSWGEDGFFYISYEDTRALKSIAYFPSFVSVTSNSHVYYYDETGMTGSYGYGTDTGYGLVKFIPDYNENIERIGTYVTTDNTILSIEIYDNFDGTNLSDLLGRIDNITCEHCGYYTFELDEIIPIYYNNDYYIKIQYYSPNYYFPIPREFRIMTYNENTPIEEPGKCWTSINGVSWTSIGLGTNHEWDLCIKAYTTIESASSLNYDTELKNNLFYPNPTTGVLNFDTPVQQIKIFNLSGLCVMTINNPVHKINLSQLQNGYYIIAYTTDNQLVYNHRISIAH